MNANKGANKKEIMPGTWRALSARILRRRWRRRNRRDQDGLKNPSRRSSMIEMVEKIAVKSMIRISRTGIEIFEIAHSIGSGPNRKEGPMPDRYEPKTKG